MNPRAQVWVPLQRQAQTALTKSAWPPRCFELGGRQEIQSRWAFPKRDALTTTDTELKLMAKAAIIGLSSRPVSGYNTPAAIIAGHMSEAHGLSPVCQPMNRHGCDASPSCPQVKCVTHGRESSLHEGELT